MSDGRAAVVTCPRCGLRHQAFEYEGALCDSCRDEEPYAGWDRTDFEAAEADQQNDMAREDGPK